MMIIGRYLIIPMFLLLTGCSTMFNIGEDKTVCEENGCDYKDAGVCGNSYDIYKNWQKAKEMAYKDTPCINRDRLVIIKER